MKFHQYAGLLLFLFFTNFLHAQNTGSVSGYVRDAKTGETLIGASVQLSDSSVGAITDVNGFYKISGIVAKTYSITARYIGFEPVSKFNVVVRSAGNPDVNFELPPSSKDLEEFVVMPEAFQRPLDSPTSIQSLSQEEIATYPGGNNDIAKVVQSLPGVSGSVGGFRNDVIIRGGAPNENVYYLDEVEIPNINHFSTQGSAGGPVGLLNVSFIDEVSLSSSAFGARYDNPLSGVLQFEQRQGNNREFNGNVRVSASEAALTLEGPLFKGKNETSKTSYIISGRRSYLQYLFKVIGLPILPDYWDYQYKITHKLNDYNELNLIGIGSIDNFAVAAPEGFDADQQATLDQVPIIDQWTTTAGLSWKRRFKDNSGYMSTTVSANILNNQFFRFRDNENQTGLYFKNDSREEERKLRYQQTRYVGEWILTAGFSLQQAIYKNNTANLIENLAYNSEISFYKYGFFLQSSRSFFDERLDFSFGIRSDANTFTLQDDQLAETLSPRISFSYVIDAAQKWRFNTSIGRYYKISPYTVLGYRNNEDELLNRNAKYIQSNHLVAGFEYLLNTSSRISIEGFYKAYDDYPVSLKDSVSLANKGGGFEVLGNEAIASIGKGRTYGIELLFQKKFTKNIYAIFAYTLFKSEFSGILPDYLPSVWDSRHLLTFTGGYKFKNNWEVSVRNRFIGKSPYVPVDEAATLNTYPNIVLNYDELGNYRLDEFNQLDLRIDKKWNFRNFSFNVYVEIQNALAQKNPEEPSYGLDRNINGDISEPRQLIAIPASEGSVLPILGIVLDF